MSESFVQVFWILAGLYSAIGLLFALPFAARGVNRIDPSAAKGSWGFRLLILPGATTLWPLLLTRWWRGSPPPVEKNAHRSQSSGIRT